MWFFQLQWIWQFSLQWLLFSLKIVTLHPWIITGYDIGNEVGIISDLLSSIQTEKCDKFCSLLNSVGTCFAECVSCSNRITKWVELWIIPILLSHKHCGLLTMISEDSFTNFCCGVVLVDNNLECLSSLTNIHLFLKCL